MKSAYSLIIQKANSQLAKDNILAGHNGPHKDPETQIRNSCHWAIIFFRCYSWERDERFKEAGLELIDKILEAHRSSGNMTFHLRDKDGKDKCNGLIGQAWVIEALIEAAKSSDNDTYLVEAETLFLIHPYNSHAHLWKIIDIDGTNLSYDPTFNHQLWFAASATPLILRNKKIKEVIYDFLSHINWNLSILPNGLIFHLIDRDLKQSVKPLSNIKTLLNLLGIRPSHLIKRIKQDPYFAKLMNLTLGYQSFNLYAFAHLNKHLPEDAPLLPSLNKSINILKKESFKNKLSHNIYAFPYNAPGFELPYIEEQFCSSLRVSHYYFKEQLKKNYNVKTHKFDINTEDSATLDARIYELAQCKPETLKSMEIPNI